MRELQIKCSKTGEMWWKDDQRFIDEVISMLIDKTGGKENEVKSVQYI